jgi:hypothetical protein
MDGAKFDNIFKVVGARNLNGGTERNLPIY